MCSVYKKALRCGGSGSGSGSGSGGGGVQFILVFFTLDFCISQHLKPY